jgi:hypothetical protein
MVAGGNRVAAQDAESCKSSPTITRMPGSAIDGCKDEEFAAAGMPLLQTSLLARKQVLLPGGQPESHHGPATPAHLHQIHLLSLQEGCAEGRISKAVHPHSLRHALAYYTTFPTRFILKTIRLGQVRSAAVYGPGGPLSPVAAQPAVTDPSDRLSTEHTLPHASPVECVLG